MVKRASLFIGGTGGSDAASARAGLEVDSSNDFSTANLAVSGNVDVGSGLFKTDDGLLTVTLANTIISGNVDIGSSLFKTDDAKITVTMANTFITGNVVIGSPTSGSGADGSVNAQDVQIDGTTVSQLGVVQTYTGQQIFGTATLTDATTIEWNLTSNQVARVKLGGDRILDNANSQVDGGMYTLQLEQDDTGTRTLIFGTDYKFPGGIAPVLTTTGNAIDVMACYSNGTSMFCVVQVDFS